MLCATLSKRDGGEGEGARDQAPLAFVVLGTVVGLAAAASFCLRRPTLWSPELDVDAITIVPGPSTSSTSPGGWGGAWWHGANQCSIYQLDCVP